MARPRARTCTAARRRAANTGVLLVMILVSLAGAMLFSAGSEHHRRDAATTGPLALAVGGDQFTAGGPAEHDHHRGNEWTPTAASRLRVVAPAGTTAHPRYEPASQPSPAGTSAVVPALPAPGELSQPGVLRV